MRTFHGPSQVYHPDVTSGAAEVEAMDQTTMGWLFHYGSSHGARDSGGGVSSLGAHLSGLPAHEAPS